MRETAVAAKGAVPDGTEGAVGGLEGLASGAGGAWGDAVAAGRAQGAAA